MKRTALLLSLLLPLAACTQAPPTPVASPSASSTATTPSAAAEAAAAEAAASPPTPAAADATTAAEATPASSTNTAAKPASGFNATGALAPGVDYVEIQGGQPFEPRNGKIEVVEVFNFICPACARFEPLLNAWRKTLPPDVRVTFVPADFNPQWHVYAQSYLVAESMGLDARSHDAVFDAIHIAHTLPGEADKIDEGKVAAFYGHYGADPKQFADAMHSFAIDGKLKRAKQFMLASGVEGTPTIIVDGKYRVSGKSEEDVLRITKQLIAQERAAGAAHP